MASCKESCNGFKSIRNDIRPYGIPKIHFIKSEWQDWNVFGSPQWPFITWRIAYLMFCAFSVTWSMSDPYYKLKHWFIFATNWTILLQLVYSTLQMLNIILFYCVNAKGGQDNKHDTLESNFLDACIWILFSIVGVVPYIVTIGYWTWVHDPKITPGVPVATLFSHGVNAIFSFIDTLLVAIPVHVTHVVYLIAFSGVYVLFSYLYEALGGTYPPSDSINTMAYIYSFLNWRETPGRAVISVAVTLITMSVFFYILWLLYVSRLYLVRKFTKMGTAVYDRHRRGKVDTDAEAAIESNGSVVEEKEYESHRVKSGELEPVDLELEGAERDTGSRL